MRPKPAAARGARRAQRCQSRSRRRVLRLGARPVALEEVGGRGHLGAQHRGRALGVGCLGDRADDRDPPGAGRGDRAGVVRLDPADREERQLRVARSVGDERIAGGRAAGARRRRVHGADADVVDRESLGRVDLLRRVRGAAEQQLRADRRAGLRDVDPGPVYVHAVGCRLRRPGPGSCSASAALRGVRTRASGALPRRGFQRAPGRCPSARRCRRRRAARRRVAAHRSLADQVEPRIIEPLARILDHGGESVRSRRTAVLGNSQELRSLRESA